ncbi:SMC-Scp complex subunit ScpB [Thermodesulfovibrio sp.]|jgi:segregation and condensation protein B|uniref:SMC-Scp complex subunit ScpB n=1 Tax=Thermodesulfovibrio TaxID=28261 RepID=UPI002628017B|nr:SMC-Scp complex subunit ScpB [Thermodesulfovibrio sp.]
MNLFANKEQIRGIVEALLFVSEKPLSVKFLSNLLSIEESEVKAVISELADERKNKKSGIIIVQLEESYQMVTNPEYGEWITIFKKFNSNNRLSEQAIETLSVIAYKQPITKAEIEKIRGVNSDHAIKSLLEKRLIKIVGKKEVPGRPFLYGTTREFLRLFGISSLKELPEISQFEKINVA